MQTVEVLPRNGDDLRARILASPRTRAAHDALMAEIPAMEMVETGGTPRGATLPRAFTLVAWNMERGLFPEASATHLASHAPSLVLLCEMDNGMARTGQRHVTADIATALGLCYVYGVEFFEMGLGSDRDRAFCADGFNDAGWHGNAILSAAPVERVTLIRLPEPGHWFIDGQGAPEDQPRIGARMALAAVLPTEAGPICAVSTHLESKARAACRATQMQALLDAIDAFAPDMPVLIGGDLNAGNQMPGHDWRHEALFDRAAARGYDWSAAPDGITTQPSLLSPPPKARARYDWIALRGLAGTPRPLIPPVAQDGTPLSDHVAIAADIRVPDHAADGVCGG